uniref:Putative secreted protein n=1 Tax=Anopheles darlingi TaxID=43151 RepID=A0A2M4DG43_ANODA
MAQCYPPVADIAAPAVAVVALVGPHCNAASDCALYFHHLLAGSLIRAHPLARASRELAVAVHLDHRFAGGDDADDPAHIFDRLSRHHRCVGILFPWVSHYP